MGCRGPGRSLNVVVWMLDIMTLNHRMAHFHTFAYDLMCHNYMLQFVYFAFCRLLNNNPFHSLKMDSLANISSLVTL